MKLTFRDLKQQKFTIDAEGSNTIAEVKEKIAAEKGWDAAQQKLIYSGKILADANTVESYNIEEKGFIVCMLSKPKATSSKPAPKAEPPSTPAVAASTPAQPPAPQANTTTSAPAASNPPATPTPASTTTTATNPAAAGTTAAAPTSPGGGFNDPSAFLVGNSNETTVREMEAMGFARPEIQRALRAAYFNPDRAIEYLLGGIPPHIEQEMNRRANAPAAAQAATSPRAAPAATTGGTTTTAAATSPPPAATADEPVNLFEVAAQAGQGQGRGDTGRAATAGAGAGGETVNMDFLRNSPHFQHLRQLVQQHPAMLQPILQQVAQGNPQLAQMIGQNQEQFLQLLAEDAGGMEGIGGMGETGPLPPGATPISVTEEERDAIERLCRLGFSRDQVIQAYFACDKNEELAANFLFDQPDDDEQ